MLRITYKGEQLTIPYHEVAYVDIDAYEKIEKEFIQLKAENAELKRMLSNCRCTNSVDNERILLLEKIEQLHAENERLRAICLRESEVLKEALKRKNSKSMIAVVAASLACTAG